MTVPRGIRNHNPLNVRSNGRTIWQGQSLYQRDPEFVTFEHPVFGLRCAAYILLGYERRGITTIPAIVARWAPGAENDTHAYAEHICDIMKTPSSAPIAMQSDAAELGRLMEAMAFHENGIQLPYRPSSRKLPRPCWLVIAAISMAYSGWQPQPRVNVYTTVEE